uniref:DNA polymerase n=1 Tax=Termitomyces sp. TaxID=1916073 RepID=A0A386TYL6_9AGAR|nr:DNA polymerase [Termitomyces sp.]AYE93271.1 DNA polymerase [Termitomyces sp.]
MDEVLNFDIDKENGINTDTYWTDDGGGARNVYINNDLFDVKFSSTAKHKSVKNRKKLNKVVNKKINELESEKSILLAKVKGGYTNYNQYRCVLGNLLELTDNKELLINRVKENLMVELDNEKLYALLINIHYVKDGVLNGISPMKSVIVTGNSNAQLIAVNILNGLNKVINEYNIENDECIVRVHWRDWIPEEDYAKLVAPIDRDAIVNEVLRDEANLNLDSKSKLDKIMKIMSVDKIVNYVDEFPTFYSVTQLEVYSPEGELVNTFYIFLFSLI